MSATCSAKHVFFGLRNVIKNGLVSAKNNFSFKGILRDTFYGIKMVTTSIFYLAVAMLLGLFMFQLSYWMASVHYKIAGKLLLSNKLINLEHTNLWNYFMNVPISERNALVDDGMIMLFGSIFLTGFVCFFILLINKLCKIGMELDPNNNNSAKATLDQKI